MRAKGFGRIDVEIIQGCYVPYKDKTASEPLTYEDFYTEWQVREWLEKNGYVKKNK